MHGVLKGQKRALDLLEPELQRITSCHVGAGNQVQILGKSSMSVTEPSLPSQCGKSNTIQKKKKKIAGLRKSLFKNKI